MIRATTEGLDSGAIPTLIIGSGPAGLTLAMELAQRGLASVVLESGETRPSEAQSLSAAEIVDPRLHDDMSIAVARRFGGASNLWGGRCVPLDPADFIPRAFTQGAEWPIGHADIAPFYAEACRYLTCGESIFDDPAPDLIPADDDFSHTHIERSSNRPRFQQAHRERLAASPLIDVRLGATVVDLAIGEGGRVSHVTAAGPDGARHTLQAERVVLAAGGLESTRLLLALQRRRPGLFGGEAGPLGRYYMGHIIGEIADIVFATDALDEAYDFRLDGHGSYVRRRFAASAALQQRLGLPNICFWPVVPPIADPRHRSGALSAVAMALSTPGIGRLLLAEAIRTRHLHGRIDWPAHARNVAADLPATLGFLGGFVRKRYLSAERISGYFLRNRARRYGLSYSSEQSPRRDSRVTLSQTVDRLGLPRLNIDLRFHREDAEAVARAHESLAKWLARSNFGHIEYRQPRQANVEAIAARMAHGTHQIGTARMGHSRNEGVVDRDLRCFDCRNLFVASSAVFPTSGQANPTLSIVALAARLAGTIADESRLARVDVRTEPAHA